MNEYLQTLLTVSNDSKYTRWYVSIVTRGQTDRGPNIGRTEKHHMLPRSFGMGGVKAKSNLSMLTPREHFICHLLLVKMVRGPLKYKMRKAIFQMKADPHGHRYINARLYAAVKKQKLPMPEETKLKLSRAKTGTVLSVETRKILSTSQQRRWKNAERRAKMQQKLSTIYEDQLLRSKVGMAVLKALSNPTTRAKISQGVKEKWQDEAWKDEVLKKRKDWQQSDRHRKTMSAAVSASITPEEKQARSNRLKQQWADPVWRAAMLEKRKRSKR